MGIRFNPQPIARYDQSLLPVLNSNFEQLKRQLASITTESIGSTPPDNPYLGQPWYDTGDLTIKYWDGAEWSGWRSFSPVVTQSVTLTRTLNYNEFVIQGAKVTFNFDLTITSTGTLAAVLAMTLPTPAANANGVKGHFSYVESGNQNFSGSIYPLSTTSVNFYAGQTNNLFGAHAGGTFQASSGDRLFGTIIYEPS